MQRSVLSLPLLLAALLFASGTAQAAPRTKTPAPPDRIEVSPSEIRLEGKRAYRQILVTGYFRGEPRDLTHTATFTPGRGRIAAVREGRVIPLRDGRETLTIRYGGSMVKTHVVVTGCAKPDPIQFKFETLAILTKQGCATGSCHGSPHGKGGFSLSLFGYDPEIDRISLTRDGFNRRINVMEPGESLMLKKPLLELSHVGGKRLRKTDAGYSILNRWIYEGANVDLPAVECTKITVTPAGGRILRVQNGTRAEQQISVLATYSDGAVRDVTAIATYESSHPSVATVDADGLITGKGRGQAAISVRYLDKLQSVLTTVVENVPGFTWKPVSENNFIDRLVDAKLKQLQYLPSEGCTDDVFLRRVSLDVTGQLPPLERTRRFLTDRDPMKRARLVDELLETEEFARFQALKKADLMRVSPRRLKDGHAETFALWLQNAMRTNMPYDRFARAILTAAGDTEKVPAANYFVAIPSIEERTEMTSQLFLGSRVECARCHNHPFENWTMRDYYRIAAVFARTQADSDTVRLAGTGESLHPTTKEKMLPWGLTSGQPEPADRRGSFADWLTRPENPLFARVEVNRIWADLMGRGIVEPVDDFRSSNPPSNAPLLDALAQEFIRSGYDRKHILRLICNSRTYQRTGRTNRFNATDESLFSHARLRQLTAEQLQDAIAFTNQVLPRPGTEDPQTAGLAKQIAARATALEPGYADWLAHGTAEVQPAPPNQGRKRTGRKLGEAVTALLKIPPEKRTDAQNHRLHTLYLDEDPEYHTLQLQHERITLRLDYATQRPYPASSEFTTTFGQPLRETACTCERQASPTLLQALELLNGGTAYRMAQEGATRYEKLPDDRLIEDLYLSGLCRFPTVQERAIARQYLAKGKDRHAAITDLVWAFVNLREFLFQH